MINTALVFLTTTNPVRDEPVTGLSPTRAGCAILASLIIWGIMSLISAKWSNWVTVIAFILGIGALVVTIGPLLQLGAELRQALGRAFSTLDHPELAASSTITLLVGILLVLAANSFAKNKSKGAFIGLLLTSAMLFASSDQARQLAIAYGDFAIGVVNFFAGLFGWR